MRPIICMYKRQKEKCAFCPPRADYIAELEKIITYFSAESIGSSFGSNGLKMTQKEDSASLHIYYNQRVQP